MTWSEWDCRFSIAYPCLTPKLICHALRSRKAPGLMRIYGRTRGPGAVSVFHRFSTSRAIISPIRLTGSGALSTEWCAHKSASRRDLGGNAQSCPVPPSEVDRETDRKVEYRHHFHFPFIPSRGSRPHQGHASGPKRDIFRHATTGGVADPRGIPAGLFRAPDDRHRHPGGQSILIRFPRVVIVVMPRFSS